MSRGGGFVNGFENRPELLIRLLPAYRLPLLHFHAVYAGNLAPPAKTRAFIDLAKEQIRDRPWRPNSPPRGRSNPNA
ncbi:MAG: hypothetical protein IPI57_01680 [Candidatus Competibacteraceae bacterium]|nr:hypothetical protein [Candidatus Competibacteraceae bacterium]